MMEGNALLNFDFLHAPASPKMLSERDGTEGILDGFPGKGLVTSIPPGAIDHQQLHRLYHELIYYHIVFVYLVGHWARVITAPRW